ncbi:MAG: glycosyltransferase family 2 protein [Candidatus Bathyarchaeia archaeon]
MRVACVIPAFNEESTIGSVIRGAKRHCDFIIVVDDGSDDKTRTIVEKEGVHVVGHITRLGVGAAISTGIKAALRHNVDVIVTLDADGQHDPDDIPSLISALLVDGADIVIGSREKGRTVMPLYKRLGNFILSKFTSLACGMPILDSQSGFRALTRKVAESVILTSIDYCWASEMLIHASRKGFKIATVPVKTLYFKERIRGAGVKDALKILYNMFRP